MDTTQSRDRVVPRYIDEEMRESFMDYAMSVIVQRALPDVRDGLKPVHRRILYSMYELGLRPDRPYKKSASVVGDVLGKYHPHGDAAVYDALVRMVQGFSLRYPLIDGQGNYGSIDGDSAAAYRYTEARLAPAAIEVLAEIEEETVDFAPNFDDRLEEPTVLPGRFPALLVNGASGIAVGMSTNIPPHNLGEIGRAILHLLDHPECGVDELIELVPGPDFPTGGLIVGRKGIRDAYETGRGRVVMRARIVRERKRGGRHQLVISEIPYGSNKTRIIEQIAALARKDRLPGVSDLRDESDRDGMRVVLDLKREADAVETVKRLYRWTSLQSTFGVIALSLVEGVPRELSLRQMLEHYRDHRVSVVVRRSEFRLRRARDEAHVIDGLLVALAEIDEVVALIKGSRNRETAARKLRQRFKLSERQAESILRMRLSRLTALETRELRERREELEREIDTLEAILADREAQLRVVREEVQALIEQYREPRRTEIVDSEEIDVDALDADETVVVMLSREGFVKRVPVALYERRVREGRPLAGMDRFESDFLHRVFLARLQDRVLLFARGGQCYGVLVDELPEAGRSSRGAALRKLTGMEAGEEVGAVLTVRGEVPEDAMVLFASAGGVVKRTPLDRFSNPRSGGVRAASLAKGDEILEVARVREEDDVLLVSASGRVIRFPAREVSVMERNARGVRGIKLRADDRVVGVAVGDRGDTLCTVTADGRLRRHAIDAIATQGRGGLGGSLDLGDGDPEVVAAFELGRTGGRVVAISGGGQLHVISASDVPGPGEGDVAVRLAEGDRLAEAMAVAGRGGGERAAEADAPTPGDAANDAEAEEGEDGAEEEADGDEDQLAMEIE